MYSANKIIGNLKDGEIIIFVRILGANKGSLGVFRGALRVPNFFVASLGARNCIPTIKLSTILKTAKLEFFSFFVFVIFYFHTLLPVINSIYNAVE